MIILYCDRCHLPLEYVLVLSSSTSAAVYVEPCEGCLEKAREEADNED